MSGSPEVRVATITLLLQQHSAGDAVARNKLFEVAYDALKQLARARLRENGRNDILDTTSLVHESYMRFINGGQLRAEDRRSFFAYASRVMRSVIVDAARERLAERRGGGAAHLTLTTQIVDRLPEGEEGIVRIHEALEVLEQAEPRLARVVEMRYFGGYTELEIAEALSLGERTVRRDCEKALLLLKAALM